MSRFDSSVDVVVADKAPVKLSLAKADSVAKEGLTKNTVNNERDRTPNDRATINADRPERSTLSEKGEKEAAPQSRMKYGFIDLNGRFLCSF
jgi:hypothetical protein